MPAYKKQIATDTVQLPSDPAFEVQLKRRPSYGDQLAAQAAMLKLDASNPGAISEMEWSAYIQTLTVAMIVDWNLTDDNDQPLPITSESLGQLSPEDGQFLATEVSQRAKTREVEQERPFALQSSTP